MFTKLIYSSEASVTCSPSSLSLCIDLSFRLRCKCRLCRAIAQAVSSRLSTTAARVRAQVSWTKWYWGSFSPSTSVYPVNLLSTNCSTITIIHHLGLVQEANSGRSTKWTQSHHTKNIKNVSVSYGCSVVTLTRTKQRHISRYQM
jgi:hypothetical protein